MDFVLLAMATKLKKKEKGFTLIELLVVVAIIGLLVTLSLVALRHYKLKAQDSRITATLSQMRSVSAQIYSDESTYSNICSGGTLNDSEDYPNLQTIKEGTEKVNGGTSPSCSLSADNNDYCVTSPLVTGGTLCVDSLGYVGEERPDCANGVCSAD